MLAERRRSGRSDGCVYRRQFGFVPRRDRPDCDVLSVEEVEPLRELTCLEELLQLRVRVVLARHEIGPGDELAQSTPELRLERRDREEAAVRAAVDPVAGELARERAGEAGELVRTGGHRHDDVRSPPCSPALEQRREHTRYGRQRTGGKVRDGKRRHRRRGGRKRAGPAHVVQVVARAPVLGTEAGDGAVHDAVRQRVGPDPEPVGDAGPERFEHDVRTRAERPAEVGVALPVPEHRFLPTVQCRVPLR